MAKAWSPGWGRRLRRERERRGWSREQLAELIKAGAHSIYRWEDGRDMPRPEMRERLVTAFGKAEDAWGRWIGNMPHLRNLYFTGRERILARLHTALKGQMILAVGQRRALSGLGGIGKTQTAVEYAYRYGEEYDLVLWVVADSRETLLAQFAGLASLFALPNQAETDQHRLAQAVKRHLEIREEQVWLLIFDNVEDLRDVQDVLPTRGNGAVLLTTRLHDVGTAIRKLDLDPFTREEGMAFFQARLGGDTEQEPPALSDSERQAAEQLWTLLGGLPLALDQAAAFVQETGHSLAEYLRLFHQAEGALLRRRGLQATDHLDSVAVTFELAWKQVHQVSPAAAELLRLCAFLAPDAIPEELFTEHEALLPPALRAALEQPLGWQEVMSILRRYSLLARETETKVLSVHRLVQAVLRAELDQESRHRWAEQAVHLVNTAFPKVELENLPQYERLLPQALQGTELIKQYQVNGEEAGRLLLETATYLQSCGQIEQVESLYRRALHLREQQLGPEHPLVAEVLNNLGAFSWGLGRYAEAERLLIKALHLWEQQLGPEHAQVVEALNNLAICYEEQGKYAEAESLHRRALAICEQQVGARHYHTVRALYNLAYLYGDQGRDTEAEPLYRRALDIWEQQLGPEHFLLAYPLTGLAHLYREQGKYAEAEPLYRRAWRIREEQFGPEYNELAHTLTGLAHLYREQGKYAEAESLYLRALRVEEQLAGETHPERAETLYGLAQLREAQGNDVKARSWYERALAIRIQALGAQHPKTRQIRQRLIALLHTLGQHEEGARLEVAQMEQEVKAEEGHDPAGSEAASARRLPEHT